MEVTGDGDKPMFKLWRHNSERELELRKKRQNSFVGKSYKELGSWLKKHVE
jgi:hypothetical protein